MKKVGCHLLFLKVWFRRLHCCDNKKFLFMTMITLNNEKRLITFAACYYTAYNINNNNVDDDESGDDNDDQD